MIAQRVARSVSNKSAVAILFGCLVLGMLIGLTPYNPISNREDSSQAQRSHDSNLRSGPASHPQHQNLQQKEEHQKKEQVEREEVKRNQRMALSDGFSAASLGSHSAPAVVWPEANKMAAATAADLGDADADVDAATGRGEWNSEGREEKDWIDLWGFGGEGGDGDFFLEAMDDVDTLAAYSSSSSSYSYSYTYDG